MSSSNPPRVALSDAPDELKDMAFDCTLMDDPVVAADGHTYNRAQIELWLTQHDTSPLTSEPLESKALFPNMGMRKQINAWREEHGFPALSFVKPVKAQAQGGGGAAAGGGGGAAILKPAAVCAFSKKPLQAYCITCRKSICIKCAFDLARCNSHNKLPLDDILSGIRDTHAAWVQVREGRPQQLQAECERVDAAVDAAVQAIREEAAGLKLELQRACVDDLDGHIEEQAQLLADVEVAVASPDAAVADSEASRCLLAAATRAARPPPPDAVGGRFEAAAAEAVSVRRLGRIVAGAGVRRGVGVGVGGVCAAVPGFLRVIGGSGNGNGQFSCPVSCAFDADGNLVVSDYGNHRIQVLRYSDGAHLRTIGSEGSGNGQFQYPVGIAFDGAGHILVAEYGNDRVQVLRYSDGAHVRTIGSYGSEEGQFIGPNAVACDGAGSFAVFDEGNARVQVFRLSDGAHLRSFGSAGSGSGQFADGCWSFLAFDAEGNLVVSDQGNHRIQVLIYSDGAHLRTIGNQEEEDPKDEDTEGGEQEGEEEEEGLGNGLFHEPLGVAFDGAGHIVVADYGNDRVQVLRYSDGAHVRTIGSYGSGNGLFNSPNHLAVDCDGRVVVCDTDNHRLQVLA